MRYLNNSASRWGFALVALGALAVLPRCSVEQRDFDLFGEGGNASVGGGDVGGAKSASGGSVDGPCGTNQELNSADECVCVTGYSGSDCTSCDSGYQDNDDDDTCLPSCDSEDCSGEGTCDDGSGSAVCACDGLRAGASCERCTAGYELVASGDCVWVGGIVQNGNFADDSAWTLSGDALIHSSEVGRLPDSALCDGGRISQQVELPKVGAAPPLVLKFKAWRNGGNFAGDLGVRLGQQWFDAQLDSTVPADANNVFCIGHGGLGGEQLLEFLPGSFPTGVCAFDDVNVDDVEITLDEDDLCPTNEDILNGSFTQNAEWTLSATASISGGDLDLYSGNQCSTVPRATQNLLIPSVEENAGAALKFTYRSGTGNGSSNCLTESCRPGLNIVLKTLDGTSNTSWNFRSLLTKTETICIPPKLRGSAVELALSAQRAGGCAAVYSNEAYVEEISLVDEPGCHFDNGIMDGDFESTTQLSAIYTYNEATNSTFSKETGSGAAEGMNNMLLGAGQLCQQPLVETSFMTPGADSVGKAAVTFSYKFAAPSNSTVTPEACSAVGCTDLAPSAQWETAVLCVDPAKFGEGIPNFLRFRVKSSTADGGTCNDTFSAENLRIDDIRATTSADCN